MSEKWRRWYINGLLLSFLAGTSDALMTKIVLLDPLHMPYTAKELFPDTIRAIFGRDRIRNAIHCTDLAKDGVLECEYFFRILADLLFAS